MSLKSIILRKYWFVKFFWIFYLDHTKWYWCPSRQCRLCQGGRKESPSYRTWRRYTDQKKAWGRQWTVGESTEKIGQQIQSDKGCSTRGQVFHWRASGSTSTSFWSGGKPHLNHSDWWITRNCQRTARKIHGKLAKSLFSKISYKSSQLRCQKTQIYVIIYWIHVNTGLINFNLSAELVWGTGWDRTQSEEDSSRRRKPDQ